MKTNLLWLLCDGRGRGGRRGRQLPEVVQLGHVGRDGLVEVTPVVVVDDLFFATNLNPRALFFYTSISVKTKTSLVFARSSG